MEGKGRRAPARRATFSISKDEWECARQKRRKGIPAKE